MTVLFLYTELADYFIKCCEELAKTCEVHIVRWPVNKEAPFQFSFPDKVKVYEKPDYTREQLKELAAGIKPDLIICSGWIDKDYLAVVRGWFKKIPTVLTCDTHWKGSPKQYLALILSRFFLLNTFSHAWVPGNIQATYVRKLGFKPGKISLGFYCCDLEKFNALHGRQMPAKRAAFPKRFLYVGRYYDFKGITDLWEAFMQLQSERSNDWELWCLGAGSIEPVQHPKIKHFGFVQPKDLEPIVAQCGVFVLPSRFEPWGVVAQEYAASGFPMLLSTAVGAGETFLQPGGNGYFFEPGNVAQIKAQLQKIMAAGDAELLNMSDTSHRLAQKINRQGWANTVLGILKKI